MSEKATSTAPEARDAAHDWLVLLSDPEATAADRKRFEDWRRADLRHAAAYERAVATWKKLGGLSGGDVRAELWRPTWRERVLAFCRRAPSGFGGLTAPAAAGAAALAAVVIVGVFFIADTAPDPEAIAEAPPVIERHATGAGETLTITLADGTVLTLGAGTELETVFSGSAREVRFATGAVLADVAADPERPFFVKAGPLTARALGTAFDVRSSASVYRVAVAEGRVEVRYPIMVTTGARRSCRLSARLAPDSRWRRPASTVSA